MIGSARHSINIVSLVITVVTVLLMLLPMKSSWAESSIAQFSPVKLSTDNKMSTTGYFHLSWQTDAKRVELQEAQTPSFEKPRTLYIGTDRATVVSGKPDGQWYYRIRDISGNQQGNWSEPVVVSIKHHSLGRAFGFFFIGMLVFVGILAIVIRSARQTHQHEDVK